MQNCGVQAHFAKNRPEKTAEQQRAQREQLLSNVPEEQRHHLGDSLLAMATDLNMVKPREL